MLAVLDTLTLCVFAGLTFLLFSFDLRQFCSPVVAVFKLDWLLPSVWFCLVCLLGLFTWFVCLTVFVCFWEPGSSLKK